MAQRDTAVSGCCGAGRDSGDSVRGGAGCVVGAGENVRFVPRLRLLTICGFDLL